MTEYTTNDLLPGKLFFRCERMRATLATDTCAEMWRKANDMQPEDSRGRGREPGQVVEVSCASNCARCPLGAVHAGEVAASMSPLRGMSICSRCHRGATRLIGGHHCPSCYNRQREVVVGCNAKGTAPQKLARLDRRCVRFQAGDTVTALVMPRSVDTDELIVAALRDSKKRVRFTYNFAPPAAMRQMRLW